VVPAKTAGQWRWTAGGENPVLTIEQKFQVIKPTLAGIKGWQAAEGTLKGDHILITAKDDAGRTRIYSGRVIGDVMEGAVKGPDGESRWQASRVPTAGNK
jgi:hypothetical protein